MRIETEEIDDYGDGHIRIKTVATLELDTGGYVRVVISTAYKPPHLKETLVTVADKDDDTNFDKMIFEWRGLNHAEAVLELLKFEKRTLEELLKDV